MPLSRLLCSVALVVLSAPLGLRGQQTGPSDPPVFRAEVDLLQLDVAVLDRARRPVRDLTASDFVVRIDGREEPVAAFTRIELPRPATPAVAWMRDVAPDVVSNRIEEDGRLVVIQFASSIAHTDTPKARAIARQAVDALRPGDLAAVVPAFRGAAQNFTADRSRLLGVIDRFAPGLTSYDEEPIACPCGVCDLQAMTRIASALTDATHRRKTLLFVGSEIRFQYPRGECVQVLKDAREALFAALERSSLTVHTVDPTGLRTLATGADTGGTPSASSVASRGGIDAQRVLNLGVLPERTGGRTIVNANDVDLMVSDVLAESEVYYLLGVRRPDPLPNGRDHQIEVRTTRTGVSVNARRTASPQAARPVRAASRQENLPASLVDALTPVWPNVAVPVNIVAMPFASPGSADPTVAIVLDSALDARPNTDELPVGMLVGAFDRNGDAVASYHQELAFPVSPGDTGSQPFEVFGRLQLKPGRHELRASVEDRSNGQRGSVYTYVDVPDFGRDPLSLSGLLVYTSGARLFGPARLFEDVFAMAPTAQRAFASPQRAAAFARVYQGGTRPARDVRMTWTVRGTEAAALVEQSATLEASRFADARSADYHVELPIAALPPGEYLLTITADLDNRTERRDLRFSVTAP